MALFNDPISAVWLILLFVALQQLEGHVVAPQVFRISLRINPILIILALLIGYQLYGIAGALVALPVAPSSARPSSTCAAISCSSRGSVATPGPSILPLGSRPMSGLRHGPRPRRHVLPVCGASLEPRVRTPS